MLAEQGVEIRGLAESVRLVRGHQNKSKLTQQFLDQEYIQKRRSCAEIGRELKMSAHLVRAALVEHRLPIRTKQEVLQQLHFADRLTPTLLQDLYTIQKRSSIEIARMLNVWPDTVVRYLKRYEISVRPQGNEGDGTSISLTKAKAIERRDRYGEPMGESRFADKNSPNPSLDVARNEELELLAEAMKIIKTENPRRGRILECYAGITETNIVAEDQPTPTEIEECLNELAKIFRRLQV